MSERQFVVRNKTQGVVLNYQQIEKNMGKVLSLLGTADVLHLLPPDSSQFSHNELLAQTMSKSTPLTRSHIPSSAPQLQQYPLNSSEAIQIIWRAAMLYQQEPAHEQEIKQACSLEHLGENGNIREAYKGAKAEVRKIRKRMGRQSESYQLKKKLLEKLKLIREKAPSLLQHVKTQRQKYYCQLHSKPKLGMTSIYPSEREKKLLAKYIKGEALKLDVSILKASTMMLFELGTKAIVIVDRSYVPFQVNIEALKKLISQTYYWELRHQWYEAIKESNQRYGHFSFEDINMCHRCQDRYWLTQQSRERVCKGNNISPDMTATAYSFQQIMLRSNYSVVEGFYSKKPKNHVMDGRTLKNYVHPFMLTYTLNKTCSRYLCSNCNAQKEEKQAAQNKKKQKQKKKEHKEDYEQVDQPEQEASQESNKKARQIDCAFCENVCDCERCSMVQNLHKYVALYETFGGTMDEITSQLVFGNYKNKDKQLQIKWLTAQQLSKKQQIWIDNHKQEEETMPVPMEVETKPVKVQKTTQTRRETNSKRKQLELKKEQKQIIMKRKKMKLQSENENQESEEEESQSEEHSESEESQQQDKSGSESEQEDSQQKQQPDQDSEHTYHGENHERDKQDEQEESGETKSVLPAEIQENKTVEKQESVELNPSQIRRQNQGQQEKQLIKTEPYLKIQGQTKPFTHPYPDTIEDSFSFDSCFAEQKQAPQEDHQTFGQKPILKNLVHKVLKQQNFDYNSGSSPPVIQWPPTADENQRVRKNTYKQTLKYTPAPQPQLKRVLKQQAPKSAPNEIKKRRGRPKKQAPPQLNKDPEEFDVVLAVKKQSADDIYYDSDDQ